MNGSQWPQPQLGATSKPQVGSKPQAGSMISQPLSQQPLL